MFHQRGRCQGLNVLDQAHPIERRIELVVGSPEAGSRRFFSFTRTAVRQLRKELVTAQQTNSDHDQNMNMDHDQNMNTVCSSSYINNKKQLQRQRCQNLTWQMKTAGRWSTQDVSATATVSSPTATWHPLRRRSASLSSMSWRALAGRAERNEAGLRRDQLSDIAL